MLEDGDVGDTVEGRDAEAGDEFAQRTGGDASAAEAGEGFQFERTGYFTPDAKDSAPGKPVFNRTISLKDTWTK